VPIDKNYQRVPENYNNFNKSLFVDYSIQGYIRESLKIIIIVGLYIIYNITQVKLGLLMNLSFCS